MIRARGLAKSFQVRLPAEGGLERLTWMVRRRYREVHAVDGIDLDIAPGELVGYLGPNGAGKSTTIKMLTGILVPTSGELEVAGFVPWRDRVRYVQHIGAVFGQRTNLWWDLPLVDSFELLAAIYRVPPERFRANLAHFTELLELGPLLDTPVRQLSLGQRMRADLAASLLHSPRLLFLDEPTIGLDVVAKERIRQFVADANREDGVTVVLTTHDLGDIERLCRRVIVIAEGKLIFDGSLDALRARFGGERELVVDLADEEDEPVVEGARVVSQDGRRVVYRWSAEALSASELIARLAARYRLVDLTVREPDIEETVRRLYGAPPVDSPPSGH